MRSTRIQQVFRDKVSYEVFVIEALESEILRMSQKGYDRKMLIQIWAGLRCTLVWSRVALKIIKQ